MAFVFLTLIYRPFVVQKILNAFNKCYNPSALWEISTASSAKAKKKSYKVASSNIYRFVGPMLCASKYYNK